MSSSLFAPSPATTYSSESPVAGFLISDKFSFRPRIVRISLHGTGASAAFPRAAAIGGNPARPDCIGPEQAVRSASSVTMPVRPGSAVTVLREIEVAGCGHEPAGIRVRVDDRVRRYRFGVEL